MVFKSEFVANRILGQGLGRFRVFACLPVSAGVVDFHLVLLS